MYANCRSCHSIKHTLCVNETSKEIRYSIWLLELECILLGVLLQAWPAAQLVPRADRDLSTHVPSISSDHWSNVPRPCKLSSGPLTTKFGRHRLTKVRLRLIMMRCISILIRVCELVSGCTDCLRSNDGLASNLRVEW